MGHWMSGSLDGKTESLSRHHGMGFMDRITLDEKSFSLPNAYLI